MAHRHYSYFGERQSAWVFISRLCFSTTRRNSRSIVLKASWSSFSGCDICPARLFFRAGINVLLPPKAEIPPGTRHELREIFLDSPIHPSSFFSTTDDADDTAERT